MFPLFNAKGSASPNALPRRRTQLPLLKDSIILAENPARVKFQETLDNLTKP